MAFGHGKTGRVLLGKYDVSRFFREWGGEESLDLAECSTLTKTAKTFVVGHGDTKVTLGGYFDGAADAIADILAAFKADSKNDVSWPFMLCPAGYAAIGRRVQIGQALLQNDEVAGSVSDAVTASAALQANDSGDRGVALADLAQRNETTTCTAVDHGAATSNGGAAVLCCTEFTDLTGMTGKIQHSTDGDTWADLVSFTELTEAGAEFVTVAAGTTVNRYTRAVLTIEGTGTFTAAVGFARR